MFSHVTRELRGKRDASLMRLVQCDTRTELDWLKNSCEVWLKDTLMTFAGSQGRFTFTRVQHSWELLTFEFRSLVAIDCIYDAFYFFNKKLSLSIFYFFFINKIFFQKKKFLVFKRRFFKAILNG